MANPHTPDTPHWEVAFEHYYLDRSLEAFRLIEPNGVGEAGELLRWYRVIEAEAITRQKSKTIEVTPWLHLEFVPSETMGLERELAKRTLEACSEVAERLGWDHGVSTLLTVLAEETDAWWATNPYGYCVSKEPFEKICLPNYLVDDLGEFSQAVAHEYAHVISSNITDEYAPRWVEEAVSVLVERQFNPQTWQKFCEDPTSWLSPIDLEAVLVDRSDDDGTKEEIWMAYQQAGWIGRYLSSLDGDCRLGEFLREIANESPLINILRTLTGKDRTDSALKRVFGITKRELFLRAHSWVAQLDESEL